MSQVLLENVISKFLDEAESHSKETVIYKPGDESRHFFYIVDGQVKIETTANGRSYLKALLSSGDIFGEEPLLDIPERMDRATSFSDVKLVKVDIDDYKRELAENPPLRLFMLELVSNRNVKLVNRLESFVNLNSRSRIIAFLIDLVENHGERVGYEHVIRHVMTHQEIADLTATSRQTVTMILNELKSSQIITFNRRRILIRNLDVLKKEISK